MTRFATSLAFQLGSAATAAAQATPPRVDRAEHREFTIAGFRTESGVTLPSARVVYGTYGHLNAARDNVVLLPSHYMANHHGYEWLIGPGQALDTARLFLVATELFGNGASSSPSNTPEPFHGPRFPVMTIRDNVEAVHHLLTEDLKVTHLRAVIGFSMGAQQAFQWATSHPSDVDAIVAICGTAKTYGHGRVRLESAISALTADQRWKDGDYTDLPEAGIKAWAQHWSAWVNSQEWWRQELFKPRAASVEQALADNERSWHTRNLNDAVQLARTWQDHDISMTKGRDGNIEHALAAIRIPVLYMPGATDLYFPVTDAQYERQFLQKVTFTPIPSVWGHAAGGGCNPADAAFINKEIAAFLK
jgi:homoserine O-acetyltransferase